MSQKLKDYFLKLAAETKAHEVDLKAQWAQNCTYIYDVDGNKISSLELVNSLPNGKIRDCKFYEISQPNNQNSIKNRF